MNTTESAILIDVGDAIPHPLNTRIINKKKLATLAKSIAEIGQTTPGIVRPHPEVEGKYQILAGHRRHAVIKDVNGGTKFFAVVRQCNDEQAFNILVTENMEREDPDPFLEADAIVKRLRDGANLKSLAAAAGKTMAWFKQRLLLANVHPDLRAWFGDLKNPHALKLAEMLGEYDHEKQLELVDTEHDDLHELEYSLGGTGIRLDERMLAVVNDPRTANGSCKSGCSHSSGQSLFADKHDCERCLNPACLNARMDIADRLLIEEHRAKWPHLLVAMDTPLDDTMFHNSEVFDKFTTVRDDAPGAVPMLRFWRHSGPDLIWVEPRTPAARAEVASAQYSGNPVARLVNRRRAWIARKVAEQVPLAMPPSHENTLVFSALFGTRPLDWRLTPGNAKADPASVVWEATKDNCSRWIKARSAPKDICRETNWQVTRMVASMTGLSEADLESEANGEIKAPKKLTESNTAIPSALSVEHLITNEQPRHPAPHQQGDDNPEEGIEDDLDGDDGEA